MNELIIPYRFPKFQRSVCFLTSLFLGAWSIYISFSEVFASRYSFTFYFGLIGLVLSVFSILSLTIWLPKTLFTVTPEEIIPNLPDQKVTAIPWTEIADLSIGLNYLKITLKSSANINIDLSRLVYSDLKDLKSKLIEFCESKNIPYKNA